MFGIPYITAPFEAEAQCAFLERSGLVDGVVTEDSDAFLFGSRFVYKNIFSNRKFVESYKMSNIEKEMGLTRQSLIRMALFLGSDYTMGVRGIGPVNCIEIINAFPGTEGLFRFKNWAEQSAYIKDESSNEE